MAITVYLWRVNRGDPPWFFDMSDMWAAVVPDHTEVNGNWPEMADPDADHLKGLIVQAYNRELAPTTAVTLADFEFIDPPEGYEWPISRPGE